MRCMHEASLYKRNCFITLTYRDEDIPERNQLKYEDFQLFMKRLRKHHEPNKLRFYMCGEYGTQTNRPHYHAIIFNWEPYDKQFLKTTGSDEKIYTSETLDRLWGLGHASVGAATFESAAYIARYCMAKVTGESAEAHYQRFDFIGEYQQTPEFNEMSTAPGLGAAWLKKFEKDVYTDDYVIINGHKSRTPAYYDKLFKRVSPEELERFKEEREWAAYQYREDQTPERLAVKEQVAKAKLNMLKRKL